MGYVVLRVTCTCKMQAEASTSNKQFFYFQNGKQNCQIQMFKYSVGKNAWCLENNERKSLTCT